MLVLSAKTKAVEQELCSRRALGGTIATMSSDAFRVFQRDFMGQTQRGARHVYLDAAATSLMPESVYASLGRYYSNACANPHTEAHRGGRASTLAIEDARAAIGVLFGASRAKYATIFCGSGATAALNRAARVVKDRCGGRCRVLVSETEHHSNLLPWLERCGLSTTILPVRADGSVDAEAFERELASGGVAAIAFGAASNVTGAVAPIDRLCRAARAAGALSVVDAAQYAPHAPLNVELSGIDLLAVSGHKLFAPGSPGVLIARRELLRNALYGDVGGGTVDRVHPDGSAIYAPADEAREEAGTPNVPGAISLGIVADFLNAHALMGELYAHDQELTRALLRGLRARPSVVVYGADDPGGVPRVGTVTFNLVNVPHGLVGAILSDLFNVSVRTHCFCAHPYVKRLLDGHTPVTRVRMPDGQMMREGMVRASLGPWNTRADIEQLLAALDAIAAMPRPMDGYAPSADGTWQKVGSNARDCFSIREQAALFGSFKR